MSLYLIGNAHLDPAWMWRWNEGFAAFAATCRSALDRISETDGFIFTASSAACFEFIEQTDPELFARIQEAVQNKRWSLAGGWWVEADCNLPSGESFIRQGLYGQTYFRSRFGQVCDTGYCIDSFGHNANLPMLLHACGMKNYVFMRPEHHEQKLDSALFRWRSSSGDEVTTYRIPLHYSNHELGIKEKVDALRQYPLYRPDVPWMLFYGVGNHGGGPTKEQIRQVLSLQEKNKEIIFGSPEKYFAEIEQSEITLPIYEGELYPHAIGAYSAHSQVKKLNRIAEQSLLRAEILSVIAERMLDATSDWEAIEEAWKPVLLNQFHDTLGGVATKEAMNDVVSSYNEAIAVANRHERIAVQRIASQIDTTDHIESLIVFNPNSFAITTPVEFELWHPEASERNQPLTAVSLHDNDRGLIPTQLVESSGKIGGDRIRAVANLELLPFGWKTFGIIRQKQTPFESALYIDEKKISNGVCMFIVSGADETNAVRYTSAAVYNDGGDTWGHGITGFQSLEGEFDIVSTEIIESGPLRVRLRVTSIYYTSKIVEDFILYADSPYIEHRIFLDWHEKQKVCKLRYAHSSTDPTVRYEIPYGSITRNADGREVPVGRWAFVEGSASGLGIVSPYKSSYSCDETNLTVTAARSPVYAHHIPPHQLSDTQTIRYLDQGEQEFTNFIFAGNPDWRIARIPHFAEQLSNPPIVHIEGAHKGKLPKSASTSYLGGDVIIPVMKTGYDPEVSGSTIVRIHEPYGNSLKLSINNTPHSEHAIIDILPYSLTTLKINEKGISEIDALERNK
ncbi:MAG TPA: glycoside hydrolase family 38 C-terminal domain-containing protein [Candidatus Kapabacteria bacterium]|nr:glycoside hydrolase family 38 C-terminal domain-containing protein [Candidatus Kapabacteria bacterium]